MAYWGDNYFGRYHPLGAGYYGDLGYGGYGYGAYAHPLSSRYWGGDYRYGALGAPYGYGYNHWY